MAVVMANAPWPEMLRALRSHTSARRLPMRGIAPTRTAAKARMFATLAAGTKQEEQRRRASDPQILVALTVERPMPHLCSMLANGLLDRAPHSG
jgi:hypothetical protein